MKKYHQQNLVEHEADSAVRECRTQSLSKLVGLALGGMGNYWQKQLWLTRSLRGPYADVRAQLRKNQSG